MSKVRVIVELKKTSRIQSQAMARLDGSPKSSAVPKLDGLSLDADYGIAPLPKFDPQEIDFSLSGQSGPTPSAAPIDESYVVRGEIEESKVEDLEKQSSVIGVFSDVEIRSHITCIGTSAVGNDTDVERRLNAHLLNRRGADGEGVLVAIVDTGINMAHLQSRGKNPSFDARRSWVPRISQPPRDPLVPGEFSVGHGTMCAFDACIAAPKCTLLDIALLRSSKEGETVMSGFLSDAVRAYAHLVKVMAAPKRPGEQRSLVVNNSWGMFHTSWDFPVGHSGNYSDNTSHPFNKIVKTLARTGADIVFAAGNCGTDCPDGRCNGVTVNTIYGANGHSDVLTVAGVDINNERVGYSSQGPGRLTRKKPDVCGYTHFSGSGAFTIDSGTSAAAPVVAGVVAAVRSKMPYVASNPTRSPKAIRELLKSSAIDLGPSGFDFDHGYGVVNGHEISRRLLTLPIDFCRISPRFCRPWPVPIEICRRHPRLCFKRRWPIPIPRFQSLGSDENAFGIIDLGADQEYLNSLDADEIAEIFYYIGLQDALGEGTESSGVNLASTSTAPKPECNCS